MKAAKQYPPLGTKLWVTWHIKPEALTLGKPTEVTKITKEIVRMRRTDIPDHLDSETLRAHFKRTELGWDLFDNNGTRVAEYTEII